MQDVFQEKIAFFLSCLALSRQHHDLSFRSRVFRSPADHPASCLLSCLCSASISGPLWETCGEWLDFSGMWQHQQVWLYNKRRLFSLWILSASQQFSQSICKEPLQMSPCKLTTYFSRKLEGPKTVQEPGWDRVIKFFACVFTERGNNHISFNIAKKGVMTHFKNAMYLMQQSWYTVVVKCLGAATQFPAFFLV